MRESLSSERALALPREPERPTALDRLAAFRFTYLAIFGFLLLYVVTVQVAEALIDRHFEALVEAAVEVDTVDGSLVEHIQTRVDRAVRLSPWVRWGGVRVTAIVLGADGRTLYVGGPGVASPVGLDPLTLKAPEQILPVSTEVVTSVPHGAVLTNGILTLYAALLIQLLFVRSRALAHREAERLRGAIEARDATARRASEIERELAFVRQKLSAVEPERTSQSEEIRSLEAERAQLQAQLELLARREAELRSSTQRARSLDEERRALEELLEEATQDLSTKDEEIRSLEVKLKKAGRAPAGGRAREAEQLGRRLRTLYKNLEIDDRAVQDLVALRDESMKLKAEENLKRLSDEVESAPIRRKVGGLPPHLSIFELGFAGKGRIYYTRGRQRRFRVLLVGAKNTQKTDLEYLSRLPRE